ncbi:uncharacterized protein LOC101854552 [Aplysia californica]|uniref:Uncharacterized protein LOC101854552 n=1 Tax=Aplysia californica TaxID=6500 RepID=A0ABM0ZV02_APLCA|nr:uncharacterized protein LOC101854552 [Aplysia californica]
MSYRDVLLLLLSIQGLTTSSQSEKQNWGLFSRNRRQAPLLDDDESDSKQLERTLRNELPCDYLSEPRDYDERDYEPYLKVLKKDPCHFEPQPPRRTYPPEEERVPLEPDRTDDAYPEPEIVNCPSGAKVRGDYIMSGSTATCECRQKTEGFPAGTVVLSQGRSTLDSGPVASGNVINTGNNNNDQTLTCSSESFFGRSQLSVSKTVKFAYGPSSAMLTFSPTNPSGLCQGTSLRVVSTCTVDPSTVNPQPEYKIYVNGTRVGTSVQQTLQLQGGAHTIRCLVENSLFPADLSTDVTETFIVRVPPPGPPEITVSQPSVPGPGEILVKENVRTRVRCEVRGGYPATSDVRLRCPSSQAGSSGVSSVVVTRSQGTQCSCTASHESGCYNKRSDVTIKAAYGPEDVTLERKNVRPEEVGTYNLCPSATSDIIMECSVGVVYPAATLFPTMTPPGTQIVDVCPGNDNKCSYKFVPSRGANHEFWCMAVNSVFGDMRGESPPVQVYVREPPKVAPKLTISGKDFSGATADNTVDVVDGEENSVVCQVDGGFPEVSPSDIYVQCDGVKVTDGKVVFTLDRNATYCTCRAQHPSGCYHLSTEVLVIAILKTEAKLQQSDDEMTIPVAVGAACAALVLCCVTAAIVFCLLKRKGCFLRKAKHEEEQSRSKKTQDNNGSREENQYEEIDVDKMSIPHIHLPALVGKSLPKTTKPVCRREENAYVDIDADNLSSQDISTPVLVGKSSSGKTKPISRQEESPYVDVDLEHISSQDIQTPVLIGRTKVEIITPDATKTDGEGRRYDNVLVTSPVSRAGPGGQERPKKNQYVDADMDLINANNANTQILIGKTSAKTITLDSPQAGYDDGRRYVNVSVTSPESDEYMSFQPKAEYLNVDIDEDMDGHYSSPRSNAPVKGNYVNVQRHDKQ